MYNEVVKQDRSYHAFYHSNKHITFRDIAVISEAGYGQIVGRMKDMIIRGGENIYPR